MKIIFMGSPEFARPSLEKLIESTHEVVAVFSQPPRKSGRGQKETKTVIHQLAEEHNIPVFTPAKLDADAQETLCNLNADIICVAAYGLLLPQAVLDIAPCVNVHPSALPRWRGAAPLQHTILAGDTTTDVCIMEMEKGLDSGPVYLRKNYNVGADETSGELHDRLSIEGGELLVEVLDDWQNKNAGKEVQQGETIYAHKFAPEDLDQIRAIDFSKPAVEIHNQIRGLSPWPSATAKHGDTTLKILGSHMEDEATDAQGGTVLTAHKGDILIAVSGQVLRLTKLQRPGKRAMDAVDFLAGYTLKEGDILS